MIITEVNEEYYRIPQRKASKALVNYSLKLLKDNSSLNTTNSTRHESSSTLSNYSLNNLVSSSNLSTVLSKKKTDCNLRKSILTNDKLPLINPVYHD